jgi:hypothetical protein
MVLSVARPTAQRDYPRGVTEDNQRRLEHERELARELARKWTERYKSFIANVQQCGLPVKFLISVIAETDIVTEDEDTIQQYDQGNNQLRLHESTMKAVEQNILQASGEIGSIYHESTHAYHLPSTLDIIS